MPEFLKDDLRKFGETTSVRGVSRAIKSADRILRITWILALIASVSMTVWQLEKVFVQYFSYGTTSKVAEDLSMDTSVFPQVTVCNAQSPIGGSQNPHLTWKEYVKVTEWRRQNLWRFVEENNTVSSVSYKDIYSMLLGLQTPQGYAGSLPIGNDMVEGLGSFIAYCVYYDWTWNRMETCGFGSVWQATFYRCVTLQSPPANKTDRVRGMDVIFYLNYTADIGARRYTSSILMTKGSGIKVAVHPVGTIADMTLAEAIAPGTETTIKVSQTKYIRLPEPYGTCAEQVDNGYTTDRCLGLCAQQMYVDNCGCIHRLYPVNSTQLDQTNYTSCHNQSLLQPGAAESSEKFLNFVNRYTCYSNLFYAKHPTCDCPIPCKEYTYNTDSSATLWPDVLNKMSFYQEYIQPNPQTYGNKFDVYAKILADIGNVSDAKIADRLEANRLIERNFVSVRIYFDSHTSSVAKDQPSMTVEILGSNIGGTLSLWMGITIMAVVELFELLYSVILTIYRSRKEVEADAEGNEIIQSKSRQLFTTGGRQKEIVCSAAGHEKFETEI